MILMPQIFHVTANENARYKCNELELHITKALLKYLTNQKEMFITYQMDGFSMK